MTCLPSLLGVQNASHPNRLALAMGSCDSAWCHLPPVLPSPLLLLLFSIFMLRNFLNVKVEKMWYPWTQHLDSKRYHSCLIHFLFILIFKICLKHSTLGTSLAVQWLRICLLHRRKIPQHNKSQNYDKSKANIILNGEKLKAFPTLPTTIQHSFGIFSHSNQERKRKGIQMEKKK